MSLFSSWNVDDSQQSGGPKDDAPGLRMAQTSVNPWRPGELCWLAPSKQMTLIYHLVFVKSRQTALLGYRCKGALQAKLAPGYAACRILSQFSLT